MLSRWAGVRGATGCPSGTLGASGRIVHERDLHVPKFHSSVYGVTWCLDILHQCWNQWWLLGKNLVSRKQGAFESQDCGLLCLDLSTGENQKVSAWNAGVPVDSSWNLRDAESKFRVSNCRHLRTWLHCSQQRRKATNDWVHLDLDDYACVAYVPKAWNSQTNQIERTYEMQKLESAVQSVNRSYSYPWSGQQQVIERQQGRMARQPSLVQLRSWKWGVWKPRVRPETLKCWIKILLYHKYSRIILTPSEVSGWNSMKHHETPLTWPTRISFLATSRPWRQSLWTWSRFGGSQIVHGIVGRLCDRIFISMLNSVSVKKTRQNH